jgi:signal transduction histidine kinase
LRKPIVRHTQPALAAIPGAGDLEAELLRLESHFSHLGHGGPEALSDALAQAQAAGDAGLLARALCLTARADVFRGRIERGIATAAEAIAMVGTLDEGRASALAGVASEAWRTAGRGYFKLGNLVEALPRLETAVMTAERALSPPGSGAALTGGVSAQTAYIRALEDLGVAFAAVRETEEAIETYTRAVAAADARPEVYRFIADDILLSLTGWAGALQQRYQSRPSANALRKPGTAPTGDDLVAARNIISGRAQILINRAEHAAAEGATPLSGYGYQSYYGALGRQLLLEGNPRAACVEFERQTALGIAVKNATVSANGEIGMATALLALEEQDKALEHAVAALARLGEADDAALRAEALLATSRIYSALGNDGQALDALEAYNSVRDLVQARDAKLYASYLASRIGLERISAEAEAQRRIATNLAALNARLEEQAAALSAQSVELIAARRAAESANEAKSLFLANMSHELRTPLNAILGFSELMLAHEASPQSGYARDIHEAGSHLLAIITDLLDLSRIEAGKMELDIETVFVDELFAECTKLVGDKAEAAGLKLVSSVAEDARTVRGDGPRLRRILVNLLSNAIKFTPSGGVVALGVLISHDGAFLFTVADTGCGMTQAEIEVAFQPFGMVDSSMGRHRQGTGLGLPLATRLTRLHGGSLVIHSEPGRGTQVTVSLPQA